MGRKPIPKYEVKQKISIALKVRNIKKIKEKTSNVSQYIEYLVEKDLNNS